MQGPTQGQGKKSLKVTFLLPITGEKPIGGFKVAYEYANFLAKQGHQVSVVHPAHLLIDEPWWRLPLKEALKTVWHYVSNRFTGGFKPSAWFEIAPPIRLLWVPTLAARNIPDGDVVVATAWQTAEWAAVYPSSKGKPFYLIQHLETWSGPEDRVYATWKAPLEKIVIARWLQAIAEDFGQTAHLVHNGLDFKRFTMTTPHEDRDANNLLMIYHTLEWKGTDDGMAAFEIARQQEPGLKLTLFGLQPAPASLPADIEYHHNPPQEVLRALYNRSSIFISPSWTEGFPLPPAEALQCGAALVGTEIDGTAMYAMHEQTALLSPIKNPEALAANILRLVRDRELRLKLAQAGHAYIQRFTWDRAGAAFEEVLLSSTEVSAIRS